MEKDLDKLLREADIIVQQTEALHALAVDLARDVLTMMAKEYSEIIGQENVKLKSQMETTQEVLDFLLLG